MHETPRNGRPNAGGGPHGAARARNPLVHYELTGEVRWVERDGTRLVLHVADANGHGGRFVGRDVTVDTAGARQAPDILPGHVVSITTRLPRRLVATAEPSLLEAHRVTLA